MKIRIKESPNTNKIKTSFENTIFNTDYDILEHKPSINGVQLSGDKTAADLNIKQDYTANDIHFSDGTTFQQKYDSGELKGEKGDQGAQGIQGEKGEKGDQGAQGIQGEKGEKGDQGAQGIQGEKGEKGDQGIQGIQGEKGDKGDQGIQGEKGENGYTPQRGIDYWTSEDVETIVNEAISNIKAQEPNYTLIDTVTVAENVSNIDLSADPDGVAYNFDAMLLKLSMTAGIDTQELRGRFYFSGEPTVSYYWWFDRGIVTSAQNMLIEGYKRYGRFVVERTSPATFWGTLQTYPNFSTSVLNCQNRQINRLQIFPETGYIPAGTVIEIYGAKR